jgi:alkaline phosphatase D
MSSPFSRRDFLTLLAAGAAAACSGNASPGAPGTGPAAGESGSTPATPPPTPPPPPLDGDPFTLGVASGDPLPDRVVLWTRLAPRPLAGGGMPDQDVAVAWEVAADERFAEVVQAGAVTAEPRHGHSVHVDAAGLDADRWYWYRFTVGDRRSPVGRTRTAPAAGAVPAGGRFRFGFGSCQAYPDGYYAAYPHLVDEHLDLMVWLGDYIYEGDFGGANSVRKHNSGALRTLDDYRNRYALYTGDRNLQAARAAQPWLVLWDDHEVENNYAGDHSERNISTEDMQALRAAAYQAWWENQPVRLDPPVGAALAVHRIIDWGRLARFFVLDERQYRDDQPCASGLDVGDCPERTAVGRSMLGSSQRDWFLGELDRTTARWNVIANEVIMAKVPVRFGDRTVFNLDQWDGYPGEQRQVLEKLGSRPDLNPLVITGDIHAYGAADLRADWDDPSAPVVGAEFVGGSVTSNFLEGLRAEDVLTDIPWLKYTNSSRHGYAVMELADDGARCRYRATQSTATNESPIDTIAEFTVQPGKPGLTRVSP